MTNPPNNPPHAAPPRTRKDPVAETLHDIEIVDPYRWLENGDDPAVQQWVDQQNASTAALLDQVPGRAAIRERLTALLRTDSVSSPALRGGYSFFMRRRAEQNQPVLYVRDGLNGAARPLVDPNTLGQDETTTIDWWYPAHDGRLLAYGLSQAGDEWSTLYVIDVASGELLTESIPRTRYASLAWLPDSTGFYYTRYPTPGSVPPGEENYNQRVFLHRLGADPAADQELFGAGRDPQEHYGVTISPDGRYVLLEAAQGWSKSELFFCDRQAGETFSPLVVGVEALYSGQVVDDQLYILTNEGAPGYRLMVAPAAAPGREHWRELIPESDIVIQHVERCGDRLALLGLRNATSLLRIYSLQGQLEQEVGLPALGTVSQIDASPEHEELLYVFTSFFIPATIYRYNTRTGQQLVYEAVEVDINSADFEVRQVWYPSKDGTPISMFLAQRRGLELNGSQPTLLTGYGGFNVSRTPVFSATLVHWLEAGGVYALPNLRGGGEYGEAWHRAGMLGQKQNVFDDFIAAAEWLIGQGYTSPSRLAILGGSNGGLLVGAALTQRPELFRAVVCAVPLLDMLRYHHFLIARLWIPEYGCAEDPQQFQWLSAYSPYHRVQPGVAYPAVLFTTAESDTRVDPCHARKMAALMQELSSGGPVLLRVETRAGHGIGKPVSKIIDEQVDVWSFIAWQLEV